MFADLLNFLHNQRDFIPIVKVIVTFPATSAFEDETRKLSDNVSMMITKERNVSEYSYAFLFYPSLCCKKSCGLTEYQEFVVKENEREYNRQINKIVQKYKEKNNVSEVAYKVEYDDFSWQLEEERISKYGKSLCGYGLVRRRT